MTKPLRASAIAIALSTGWALPAHAAPASNAEVQKEIAAMRAQMERMAQRIDTLEAQLQAAKADAQAAQAKAESTATAVASLPKVAPMANPEAAAKKPTVETTWKGAPETSGSGFTFKPRGRLHYDIGSVSTPGALNNTRNLGFNSRFRRLRLGVEGTIPGDFGYKAEVDFASAGVAFGDVWITYNPAHTPIIVRAGNFELNDLEQTSSSNFVTFTERSAVNEAFANNRRLGTAVTFFNKDNSLRADVGLFVGHSIDSSFDNNSWVAAGRAVYAPKMFGGQLHLGANYQYRDFASNNGGIANPTIGSPSTNQLARYRARPNSQLTDIRFIDTGNFAAKSDQILGVELAGIWKGIYVAGEAQWLKAKGYNAGDKTTGLDTFSNGNIAVVPAENPTFFGGYAEIGYFLTGETRGYSKGTWARTKVLNPVGKGGLGAFQLATRLDYVDLDDPGLKNGLSNNFTTGISSLDPLGTRLGRGGTQTSYLFGLNWYPNDYTRFMFNYGHVIVKGGPLAALVKPLTTDPIDQRSYGVDAITARMQIDF